MGLLKLLALAVIILLAWVVWQRRHMFVRHSPQGSTRTKLSRNYKVQRDFLEKVSQTERMKLVALAYAACGFDAHHHFVHATARELSDWGTLSVKIAFRRVFKAHRFSFNIDEARNIEAHYQLMCSKLSVDVEFLRIYLEYRAFLGTLTSRLIYSEQGFAYRNPDVVPSEDVLQLLWTENLERP